MIKAFILTPEQQEFAENNHNLVFKFLNENRLDENEYYDVVIFGYLRAVKNFLERPTLQKYPFSKISWNAMRSCLANHFASQNRQKRSAYTVSLNSPFLEESIAATDSLMMDFEMELLLHAIASAVSKQQMRVILMKKDGHGIKEIAKDQRLPMKAVQKLLSDAQDIINSVCYG